MKIQQAETTDRYLKVLVYGASKVGKTRFAGTAPAPLFIDAEAGMLSVKDKKIDRVKVETFADVIEAFEFLKAGKHSYQTVVLDSTTEIQKKSMDQILAKGRGGKPTIADWGENIDQMRRMARHFRDLPLNLIMIALEGMLQDEETGKITRIPALQGKTLPQEMCGFVDIVGYLVAKEKITPGKDGRPPVHEIVRAMRVQPGDGITAGDRSDKLGVWVEPDFGQIYAAIFGGKEDTKCA